MKARIANRTKRMFSEWLQSTLRLRDLTQSAFADMIGVSPSAVTDWVKERAEPRNDKIEAIAEVLGVSPNEIRLRLGRMDEELPISEEAAIIAKGLDSIEDDDLRIATLQAIESMIKVAKLKDAS